MFCVRTFNVYMYLPRAHHNFLDSYFCLFICVCVLSENGYKWTNQTSSIPSASICEVARIDAQSLKVIARDYGMYAWQTTVISFVLYSQL